MQVVVDESPARKVVYVRAESIVIDRAQLPSIGGCRGDSHPSTTKRSCTESQSAGTRGVSHLPVLPFGLSIMQMAELYMTIMPAQDKAGLFLRPCTPLLNALLGAAPAINLTAYLERFPPL